MAVRFISAIIFGFSLGRLVAADGDIRFLAAAANCLVSFESSTQAGKETHRLEVRRLATIDAKTGQLVPVWGGKGGYYVLYTAGIHSGPAILGSLDGAIDPEVRLDKPGIVEIFYLAGAHTHIRERWRLLGHTAECLNREEIDWRDDPRMKAPTKD